MPRFDSQTEMDAFLAQPRLAVLMTNRSSGVPIGVPVWFEWADGAMQMFAAKDSPKVARIGADPQVSVLVTNHVGEPEGWVAFDGACEILHDGTGELIARLAPRYWDLSKPEAQQTIDSWVAAADAFVRLQLRPQRIRSGQ